MNQPIKQLVSQSANRSTNQSVNRWNKKMQDIQYGKKQKSKNEENGQRNKCDKQ